MTVRATTQVIRPAGAGHETLYVLLFCLLVLAAAASVVAWHGERQQTHRIAEYQVDARRDLSPGEQGIYADLRVTLDEIRLLREESGSLPLPEQLAEQGFAPFARDASSISRGGHVWHLLEQPAYLGLSQQPDTAGSFLMRVIAGEPQADIWLNPRRDLSAPQDLGDQALIASGWKQIAAQFDAGVTRQHRH
ncbi:DUF6162 family protein [Pseudomonas sp. NPDC087358]|uniref:DUF6162 family protein n=1 Tax=Pseudomonas sp. NPDC087358 TaxID=3364439 RepID=UPI00384E30DD